MAICEIIPKLHGKFSEHMNVHAPASGIFFSEVGEAGGILRDFTEAFEELALLARW